MEIKPTVMIKRAKVILISGKMGAGKSSLAKSLVEVFMDSPHFWTKELRFAGPMYQIHNAVYETVKQYGMKLQGVKDGRLLQTIGKWGRDVHGNKVWIQALLASIHSFEIEKRFSKQEHNLVVIVDDMRTKKEFDAFPDAVRIRLECGEKTRRERCSDWRRNKKDFTEIDLDEYSDDGRFDLYIHTDKQGPEESLNKVLTYLGQL